MPITVVLGAHNLTENEPSQQKIKVKECIPHPSYDGAYDFDIMLLKVSENLMNFDAIITIFVSLWDKV